nr:hypothetical protein [Tanacetum cinerariifolium]
MDLEHVLEQGHWLIRNTPIILNKWTPNITLSKDEVSKVSIWVKMHKVPIVAYSKDGLSLITTQIGTPIIKDAFTSSMCVDSWGRIGFVRALIEVSADKELKHEVTMVVPIVDATKEAGEALVSVYNHFAKLMNDLERNDILSPNVTVNTKFLNCLHPEWLKKSLRVTMFRMMLETYKELFELRLHELHQMFNATTVVRKVIMLIIVQSYEFEIQYLMKQILIAKHDEAGVIITDEQNDFLFADASRMEEIEELSANICLMARIQPTNFDSDEGPSYDYAFLSEVQTPSTSYVNPLFANDTQEQKYLNQPKIINNTIGDDQINSNIIFDEPNRDVNSASVEYDNNVQESYALEQLARNAYKEAEKQQIISKKVLMEDFNVALNMQDIYARSSSLNSAMCKFKDCALDLNPTDSYIRKEESVYLKAFNEAKLDEDWFLKQKAKIDWLEAGVVSSNNIKVSGSHVPEVFISHYEHFLGTSMKCNELNVEGLFSKSISATTSSNMVRDITNDEIKAAMFDIDDEKASGPDGYTSAFFKKGLSVVGHDVCNAVWDFFSNGCILKEINYTFLALIPKGIKEAVSDNQSAFMSDDLFIFARGELASACVILESLNEFKMVWGLVPIILKGKAKVAWDDIYLPKEEGGLGLHSLDAWEALRPRGIQRTALSILGKLILAASSYFIWLECNNRVYKQVKKSPEDIHDIIMVTVRLKLLTFRFKDTSMVNKLLARWKMPKSFRIYG